MAGAGLDYLNSPAADDLETAAVGAVLISLSELAAGDDGGQRVKSRPLSAAVWARDLPW